MYTVTNMARPRKLETLTRMISGRIRPEQEAWLEVQAERQFDGELSRTLRWALDQAAVLTVILAEDDPVEALDRMLHPEKYPDPDSPELEEKEIAEAEREFEQWKREQAIKRAMKKKDSK